MHDESTHEGTTPDGTAGADPGAPLAFALGCVRSGTTMLRAMLDSHPQLAVPPESYFVTPALHRAARYGAGAAFDLDALTADIAADPSFGDWHLDPAALAGLGADPRPGSVPEALDRLYRAYAHAHGKPRAADRTPSHVLEIDLLARAFPRSPFVHIVRDGRDVATSVLEMDFGPDRFPNAVLFWEDRVRRARAAGRRLGPDRFLEIRYEDLVADPEPRPGTGVRVPRAPVRRRDARLPRAGERAHRRAAPHRSRAGRPPPAHRGPSRLAHHDAGAARPAVRGPRRRPARRARLRAVDPPDPATRPRRGRGLESGPGRRAAGAHPADPGHPPPPPRPVGPHARA